MPSASATIRHNPAVHRTLRDRCLKMEWFRLIAVTAICGGLSIFLVRVVFSGLRSGRIAHTDSSSFCKKQENPLGYWTLVILFTATIFGCLFIWGQVAYGTVKVEHRLTHSLSGTPCGAPYVKRYASNQFQPLAITGRI